MLPFIASLGSFLPGLFGKKISYGVAKVLGFVVLGIGLVALLGLGKCAYDRSVVNQYKAEADAKAGKAREKAADQRVEDEAINTKSEKELHDAINSAAPGGDLSPAARALACERLRRVGRLPAACGHQGGN